mmetsp:Transcript_83153/g.231376  ORF Transcript_83153/g.231376 Transcript_83153/m.231376 type:complete len:355 (+) Transcript_83153:165-1229(+)
MALNPPLGPGGLPVTAPGELYLLRRDGIGFKCEAPGIGTWKANGCMIMTTRRLCFVARSATKTGKPAVSLQAFDVPYANLSGEKFNQPIFGANYISGNVAPVPGMGLPTTAEFRLTFNEGGVGTFLRLFFVVMDRERRAMGAAGPAAAAPAHAAFADSVRAGTFFREQQAYVDPSDPSVLYVAQPAVAVDPSLAANPYVTTYAYGVPVATAYSAAPTAAYAAPPAASYAYSAADGSLAPPPGIVHGGAGGAGTYATPPASSDAAPAASSGTSAAGAWPTDSYATAGAAAGGYYLAPGTDASGASAAAAPPGLASAGTATTSATRTAGTSAGGTSAAPSAGSTPPPGLKSAGTAL